MRDRTYRVLICILAVWGAVHIPTLLHAMLYGNTAPDTRYFLAIAGLAILPIAVVGMCLVHRWGFILMGAAFIICLASSIPMGAPIAGLILLFASLRYWLSRHERNLAAAAAKEVAATHPGSRCE